MSRLVYPQLFRVRQTFPRVRVDDASGQVRRELEKLGLGEKIGSGKRVAITAGSRGIANIHVIIKAVVDYLHQWGAKPFVVPAMGSHGGATASGQRALIEQYGITEDYCGCPILASMETVVVCHAAEGFPIHFDRHAYEADFVLVCGRVRPHTMFTGEIESGLLKMMLVGLGKHVGARIYHAAFQDHNFDRIVRGVAGQVIQQCDVAAGLAVVENAYEETAAITGVLPEEFESKEKELLALAKLWMPRLPFSRVDVLLIDEIGKNISGTGMDTNVVGRKYNDNAAVEHEIPKVKRIIARNLTPESGGNAVGIGIADFCTRRLAEQINQRSTWINGMTAGHMGAVKTPPVYDSDRELVEAAFSTIGLTTPAEARLLWIKNTSEVTEIACSAAYWEEAQDREDLEVLTPLRPLPFDLTGNLPVLMTAQRAGGV